MMNRGRWLPGVMKLASAAALAVAGFALLEANLISATLATTSR